MLKKERHKHILCLLEEKEIVSVSELTEHFGVSAMTIRRDLEALEGQGLVQRVHGGVRLGEILIAGSYRAKAKFHLEEKREIGSKAADMVPDLGDIIIDNGTTTIHLARSLPPRFKGQVVTNSLYVAADVANLGRAQVIVCGGVVNTRTGSLVGPEAEQFMSSITADQAFLGTAGISLERGFSASDSFEAAIKNAMVRAAGRVIVLADHSKFNKHGLFSFASLGDVEAVVTDMGLSDEVAARFRDAGLKIIK